MYIGSEAIHPDLNLFDFALTFDSTTSTDRLFRPHTLIRFEEFLELGNLDQGKYATESSLEERPFFCDFIYSNATGHPMRQNLLRFMKQHFEGVRSLGEFLPDNPRKIRYLRSKNQDWRQEKINLQRDHRFSLCIENAEFPGYTSEKLLTSFIAGSIPIYWGNPKVGDEFNAKKFINLHEESPENAIQKIRSLSGDTAQSLEVVREQAMTNKQHSALQKNRAELHEWFNRLFYLSSSELQRRPTGAYVSGYQKMVASCYRAERLSFRRSAAIARAIVRPPR